MPELWWCLDCHRLVRLDIHLRCEVCGSDSVSFAQNCKEWEAREVNG